MKAIELKHKNLKFIFEVIKTVTKNKDDKYNSSFLIRFSFLDINTATEYLIRSTKYHHVLFEKIEFAKVDNVNVSYKYFEDKYKSQFFDCVLEYLNDAKKEIDKQIDNYLDDHFFDEI